MKAKYIILAACLMAIFGVNAGECTIYYVKNAGNDSNSGLSDASAWKTIQKVNSFSFNDGDTICFKRGDTFSDSRIKSPGKNNITFMDYGDGEKPYIDGHIVQPFDIEPASTISGLTIKNFEISGQDWQAGKESNLYITNVNGVTIDGVVGDGHKNGNVSDGKTAIQLYNCTGKVVITNCQLSNWGPSDLLSGTTDFMGIVIYNHNSGSYVVSNNSISYITSDGIHLCDNTATGLVTNNKVSNCGEQNIDLKGSSNCTVIQNEFFRTSDFSGMGGSGAGSYANQIVIDPGYVNGYESNNTIQDNIFRDSNVASGISMDHANNTKIIGNHFSNIMGVLYIGNPCTGTIFQNNYILNPVYRLDSTNMDSGGIIENNAGSGTMIVNNTFCNISGSAKQLISLASSVGTTVTNNIVYQQSSDSAAYVFYRLNDGSPPVVNHNCWFNTSTTVRVKYGATVYKLADQSAWAAAHPGDIFVDPLFTNPSSFQLSASTPCQTNGSLWGAPQLNSASIMPPASIKILGN